MSPNIIAEEALLAVSRAQRAFFAPRTETMIDDKIAAALARKKWKTRDGTVMSWGEMTVSHLRNTAAMLRRSMNEEEGAAWGAYSAVSGEFAELAIESGIRSMEARHDETRAFALQMEAYAEWREKVPAEGAA